MSARDDILAAIRASQPQAPPPPPVSRPWDRTRDLGPDALADRLTGRLRAYGAHVRRCAPEAVAAGAAEILALHGITRLAVPPDLDPAWLPPGVAIHPDAPLAVADLESMPGVMTEARLAIAETGTIVLDAGPGQGRRLLTLLPDFYLCVVRRSTIVAIMPEAIAQLREAVAARRPITFVSGPSATADIELDRVQGVHGPRTLAVLLIEA
jgi:L-lactate dehydrogenase complex protein LldG